VASNNELGEKVAGKEEGLKIKDERSKIEGFSGQDLSKV
jgi:hypothetical protein